MKPRLWHRQAWLAVIGLSASAWAVAAPPADEGPRMLPTEPVSKNHQAKKPALEATHVELERLKRPAPPKPAENAPEGEKAPEAAINNIFAATSWYVPPPPPPPPPPGPPPKPTAPPLPFIYMGRYEDAGEAAVVMLLRGDQIYTVSEGDVIDNTYRVAVVRPTYVELIYLPLNIRQSLQTS